MNKTQTFNNSKDCNFDKQSRNSRKSRKTVIDFSNTQKYGSSSKKEPKSFLEDKAPENSVEQNQIECALISL
jgi:hypothetical protein